MKKVLAFAIVCLLLLSFASADSMIEFSERWNRAAHVYGAPELGEYSQNDSLYTFTGDGWSVDVTFDYGLILEVIASSESSDTFLALCANAGVAAVEEKTAEDLSQYDGNILTNYLRIVSDRKSRYAAFYSYQYFMEKTENGFTFSLRMQ